jgi:hypothetical protein
LVFTLDSRFLTWSGPAHHRVEDLADLPSDDEVGAQVVQAVHAQDHPLAHAGLDPEVELLHARVLQRVVDDVDAGSARAGQREAREGIREMGRERRELPGGGVDEEDVARPDLDGQGPAVQPALQRHDLERHPVVVDAVAAVHAVAAALARPVEAHAGGEVVPVTLAVTLQEGLDQRVDVAVAADVLHVGVHLVPEADVQGQAGKDAPVVLHEERKVRVVAIGQLEVAVGEGAAQRHGEQQVLVVDAAVAVVVEAREVLDELDASLAEHAQVEGALHALDLAAEAEVVGAEDGGEGVRELPAVLVRGLGHAEGGPVLEARERELAARVGGIDLVTVTVPAARQRVHPARAQHARPGGHHRVVVVRALLALGLGADGAVERAGSRVVSALRRVAQGPRGSFRWASSRAARGRGSR